MSSVLSIVLAICALGVLIFFHELGHFLSARATGLAVMEFALGFGPKLISFKRKDTRFSLRLLPLGGYCRFYGEDEDLDDPRAYNLQPVWKRFVSVLCGPLMNFLVAIALTMLVLMCYGEAVATPVIQELSPGMPAVQAGLQPGDRIVAVDGTESGDVSVLSGLIGASSDTHTITVERNGEHMDFDITPFYDAELGRYRVGFTFGQERVYFSLFEALGISMDFIVRILREMITMLGGLIFRGEGAGDVVGPVGTVGLISQTAQQGMEQLLRISILISVNLGLVNLLPLPALDGGRLVFLTIEGIRRKPLNRDKEAMVHFIGFVVLIALILVVTGKDILNLFWGA